MGSLEKISVSIIGSRGYPHVYSGYETFIKELVEQPGQNVEYTVYCHKPLFNDKPAIHKGVVLYYLPAIQHKAFNQLSNSFLALVHALFVGRPDIILFVNTANGPFAILASFFGVKTAMITDGLEWKRPKWRGLGAKYFKWATQIGAAKMDVLIADSIAMRSIFRQEFGRDSEFISYGAHIKNEAGDEVLADFDLSPGSYYLIVGRMIPDNNVHLLIEGFQKSRSKRKLVVVGDAPFNDPYAKEVKAIKDERIVFTGYVTNQVHLAQLYHHSFAYFHGHEFGGTNPTLLKALAYGCAVLAIDTVFSREVLEDGRYGLFFEKTAESVAACINANDTNSTLLEGFKQISRNRIADAYQWPEVAKRYDNLFQKMHFEKFKSAFIKAK